MGHRLRELQVNADLVAGLPRGGVVVAAAVAEVLRIPMEVLVVRKIGHPEFREFAIGALAEGGIVHLNQFPPGRAAGFEDAVRAVIVEETSRLNHAVRTFHGNHALCLKDKSVILVDDGLATGSTMHAAVLAAKAQKAKHCIVAVPVAAKQTVDNFRHRGIEVVTVHSTEYFDAVGNFYDDFAQTSDEEVLALLGAHSLV